MYTCVPGGLEDNKQGKTIVEKKRCANMVCWVGVFSPCGSEIVLMYSDNRFQLLID